MRILRNCKILMGSYLCFGNYGLSVDPTDEDGVGQGEDGEEDEVGADPVLACGGGVGEEWRDQPEKEE
jgi:hypothetical protein